MNNAMVFSQQASTFAEEHPRIVIGVICALLLIGTLAITLGWVGSEAVR